MNPNGEEWAALQEEKRKRARNVFLWQMLDVLERGTQEQKERLSKAILALPIPTTEGV